MSPDVTADRIRQQILRRLSAEGNATVDALAERLNVNDARVLWHLRQLRDARLVTAGADDGQWRLADAGLDLDALPALPQPGRAFPPEVIAHFEQAFKEAGDGLFGSDFVQNGGWHGGRLSREQAAEFGERLQALVAEYFAPGQGDRSGMKYGLYWVLTPIDVHPLSDQS